MLDTFPAIDRLNLDYVSEQGYTALRCNWMQCPKTQVEPEPGFEDGEQLTHAPKASAEPSADPHICVIQGSGISTASMLLLG